LTFLVFIPFWKRFRLLVWRIASIVSIWLDVHHRRNMFGLVRMVIGYMSICEWMLDTWWIDLLKIYSTPYFNNSKLSQLMQQLMKHILRIFLIEFIMKFIDNIFLQ
jgi:hypothetical protein